MEHLLPQYFKANCLYTVLMIFLIIVNDEQIYATDAGLASFQITKCLTNIKFVTFSASLPGMGDTQSLVQETASLVDQELLRGQNRALLCLARVLHPGN